MTEKPQICEDNIQLENYFNKVDGDCNSSSGGSIYQEFQGRSDECAMYSTDDEFMDATETIRAHRLGEEEQLSTPVIDQLTGEKGQYRYTLVDMPRTDSESNNCFNMNFKEGFSKINLEQPTNRATGQSNIKNEKNKPARALRLPSAVTLPVGKADRPARGDSRRADGVSRIPIAKKSATKLRQPTPVEEILTGLPPRILTTPRTRNATLRNEESQDENPETLKKKWITDRKKEEISRNGVTENDRLKPNVLDISKNEKPSHDEKSRPKRVRSHLKDDGKEEVTLVHVAPIVSMKDEADVKRMRMGSKSLITEENQETHKLKLTDLQKRKQLLQAHRRRVAKAKLSVNSRDEIKQEPGHPQKQISIRTVAERQTPQESSVSVNSNKIIEHKMPIINITSSNTDNNPQPISMNKTSARNFKKQRSQNSTPAPSPQHTSPSAISHKSIIEKREQILKSKERASGDVGSDISNKVAYMPEIKQQLIKLKSSKMASRHQDNIPSVPMKTSAEKNNGSSRGQRHIEKHKIMIKQRETANNKSDVSDAIQTDKKNEKQSRERQTSVNKMLSSSAIQKPSSGNQMSIEKTSISVNSSLIMTELQGKPLSSTAKVTLSSLQNIYRTNYKRYEEHLVEIEKAKHRVGTSMSKLDSLRQQILQISGEDPGQIIPQTNLVRETGLPAPTIITAAKGMNTEDIEEGTTEAAILQGDNQKLTFEIERLKKELEEAKELKKDADLVADLKRKITEMVLTKKLVEKRLQTLEKNIEDQKNVIVSLQEENERIADIQKLLKEKDQQLSDWKRQYEEKNQELENAQKKIDEAKEKCDIMQEELHKRKEINLVTECELGKVMDERNAFEKQLQDLTYRHKDFEEREECLLTRLENEKKKVMILEEEVNRRTNKLDLIEKKCKLLETTSSQSVGNLSEQLLAKEAIVNELENLKVNFESQNRELCCLISNMFSLKGKIYDVEQIQASVSAGGLPILRDELFKIFEERVESNNLELEDAMSKIDELHNQVKVLQIELDDSKMVSERLTNIISQQNHWESEKTWEEKRRPQSAVHQARHPMHHSLGDFPIRETISHRDGDMHSIVPSCMASTLVCSEAEMARNNFNELFVLLEGKRRALMKLERKLKDMEEVHSHCAHKRTRNETRIAQLEMMLASYYQENKC